MHLEIFGDGPELALLHGWGMHGGVWSTVGERLAERFRLHVIDLPGYGASGTCAPHELPELARRVAAVLPPRVAVCGWSLGGQVALQLALDRPDQVSRLVLTATTPCFARRPDWEHGIATSVLSGFAEALEQDYEGTLKRFLSLQAGDARAVAKELRGRLFERGRPEAAVLKAGLDILLQTDLRPRLPEVKQSALLIHGARDQLTPASAARWAAQALPHARLAMLADAGHAPFLSHAERFADELTEFLHEH